MCGFGSVENVDEFDPKKPCPECGTIATPAAPKASVASWDALVTLANVIGKTVLPKGPPPAPYDQTPTTITVPIGDTEALLHELCHWVVATPEERSRRNLGMVEGDTHARLREEQAWRLELWLLSPFATEREVFDRLSHDSQQSHPLYNGGWTKDAVSCLRHALDALTASGLPFVPLSAACAAWDTERRTGPSSGLDPALEERAHVLLHLRNAATVARNRGVEIALNGNSADAKKYTGRAEHLGQLANQIEKGKHLPRGKS